MEVGEFWAHRTRAQGPVARVEVLRLGTKRPARVKVRFTADEEEGREAWVPPSQLCVPWEEVDRWLERERRWKELSAATPPRDVPERRAVDTVFEVCPWDELASVGYSRHDDGVLYVHDVTAFAEALKESAEFLTGDPLTVVHDDGSAEAPWPVTFACARKGATLHADQVMAEVEREEQRAQREAIYGSYTPGRGKREGHHFSPAVCAHVDRQFKPARDLVRHWCGAQAVEAYAELRLLRAEVVRLGRIVEQAVGMLQQAGRDKDARKLEAQFEIPVAEFRRMQPPS
ncbi:hypothetical protein [Streptomyces sp. NPDC021562]|uniref:hypothetical protein n=1 Tax=Streptomyces sp. NPDC021562 TaxID=3155121 RepID=UPI003409E25E